jgi:hypothetical protein
MGINLLAKALANCEEVGPVLSTDELLSGERVLLKELGDEGGRVIELGDVPKDRGPDVSNSTSEAVFDAAKPIIGQVTERPVDLSLLLANVHEENHAEDILFVSVIQLVSRRYIVIMSNPRHVADVLDDRTITLRNQTTA